MDAAYRGAHLFLLTRGIIGGAQRVIEDNDSRGAGYLLYQLFDLWIVYGFYFGLIVKVLYFGSVIDENKSFTVEGETGGSGPAVMDVHGMFFVLPRMTGVLITAGRVRIGNGFLSRVHKVIQRSRNGIFRLLANFSS